MNLGSTIKEIRLKKGFKQNSFAKMCDITQAYLSKIESNNKEPNVSVLKTIASQLEIPLPVLFFLAIDSDDVDPRKKEAFQLIDGMVKSIINNLFVN